jgi:hypothetical protein
VILRECDRSDCECESVLSAKVTVFKFLDSMSSKINMANRSTVSWKHSSQFASIHRLSLSFPIIGGVQIVVQKFRLNKTKFHNKTKKQVQTSKTTKLAKLEKSEIVSKKIIHSMH